MITSGRGCSRRPDQMERRVKDSIDRSRWRSLVRYDPVSSHRNRTPEWDSTAGAPAEAEARVR